MTTDPINPTNLLADFLAKRAASSRPPVPRLPRRSIGARGGQRCAREFGHAAAEFANAERIIASGGALTDDEIGRLLAMGRVVAALARDVATTAADYADATSRLSVEARDAVQRQRELSAAVLAALRKHDGAMDWQTGNPAADAVVNDVLAAMIAAGQAA